VWRDADGGWSVTVGPLAPDTDDYGFSIDGGLHAVDTMCPHVELFRSHVVR
jgi:hypothetical protein